LRRGEGLEVVDHPRPIVGERRKEQKSFRKCLKETFKEKRRPTYKKRGAKKRGGRMETQQTQKGDKRGGGRRSVFFWGTRHKGDAGRRTNFSRVKIGGSRENRGGKPPCVGGKKRRRKETWNLRNSSLIWN